MSEKQRRLTRREARVLAILQRHVKWSSVTDDYEPEARALVALGRLEQRRRHPDAFAEFRFKATRA